MELVTEFFNTEDPQEIPAGSDDWYGLQDSTLKFGKLTMTHGKAFAFKGTNTTSQASTSVYKSWQHIGGRTFLIEAVPVLNISENLNALPLQASIEKRGTGNTKFASLATSRSSLADALPPSHPIAACTNHILLASADFKQEPGLVLDYNEIDDDQGDYTFQSGQTYYITGPINFGNVVLESGTVIKFSQNNTCLAVNGSLTCPGDPDHPAMLTAQDDCSVGENLGMGGSPSGSYANIALYCPNYYFASLQNIRICYANEAIQANSYDPIYSNCQFLNCNSVFTENDGNDMELEFDNCLFGNISSAIMTSYDCDAGGDTLTLKNCTVDSCGWLVDNSAYNSLVTINSYDSLFSNCGWRAIDPPDSPTLPIGNSSHNGYYGWETNTILPGEDTPFIGTSYPFKSAANANYYLADNTFRDIGCIGVANAANVTTYTPQDGGFPDTNSPDLGYHYQVNEDSDFDGIPDWWIYQYFGNYNYNGTNLDASGNTLLSDYQSYTNGTPVDPNVILFSIEATNDYVNSTSVSLQLNLQAGAPAFYAVFFNQTSTTNWLPFVGTNLTVTLGTTDGVYDVVVGLKGFSPEATQTWQDYDFTLDRVPPLVTITNPDLVNGSATVIKPYLQLEGFANKPLFHLSYDITNDMGAATNLDVLVTDQNFDTIKSDFTTNFFQAYDVQLTNGVNSLTLRVTDRAGNTTTTNFNVVLDYTSATNPPVVSLLWPQDGMVVSSTNITIRGTMSDETGSILAQIINGDGTTNEVTGLIERNNMFWIEDVPLNGTNIISIQATDAAGNVTTTNFTVYPGSLGLTIDTTPTGDALWQPTGSVGGTVNDSSATVIVNGVVAAVDPEDYGNGSYNWTAAGVPNLGNGTVTFDAKATSADDSTQDNANASVVTQPYVTVVSYNYNEMQNSTATDTSGNLLYWEMDWNKDYQSQAQTSSTAPTFNGSATHTFEYDGPDDYTEIGAADYDWSTANPGSVTVGANDLVPDEFSMNSPFYGEDYMESLSQDGFYYAEKSYSWDNNETPFYGYQYVQKATLDVRTQVKLWTGGKGTVARQNLFRVQCQAAEFSKPEYRPLFIGGPWVRQDYPDPTAMAMFWTYIHSTPIDPTTLTVLGKQPGADGVLWKALPDNTPEDLTITASGKKHYSASAIPQKYKLNISVNGNPLWINKVPSYNNYCVGQYLNFTPHWSPGLPETPQENSILWTFDGTFVNKIWATDPTSFPNASLNYTDDLTRLQIEPTYAWWVSGGPDANTPATYNAVLGMGLTFQNGQYVAIATHGQFNMWRPKAVMYQKNIDGTPTHIWRVNWQTNLLGYNFGEIGLGSANHLNDMDYNVQVISPKFNGNAKITQICSIDCTRFFKPSLHIVNWCDNEDPYPNTSVGISTVAFGSGPYAGTAYNLVPMEDGPANAGYDSFNFTGAFIDYIMFNPSTSGDDIFVTLGKVNWGNSFGATYPSTTISPNTITSPSDPDGSTDFPSWLNVWRNSN
ncbi:MAG TPA: hypothetical protein VK742_01245 [Candidatus Sulfotelmatobacter sp.]|nr:hypothetical protein [Candidatus Sulfotelmatobacter sp.]